MSTLPDDLKELIAAIQNSKKYRDLDMFEPTIADVIQRELPRHKKQKDAVKAARRKLHKIFAPYLGNPDYDRALNELQVVSHDSEALKDFCRTLLGLHDSTRERLAVLEGFYQKLFAVTGKPKTILDIASGLNPLTLPWMELDQVTYYAYEIHRQRADFLTAFFEHMVGVTGRGIVQDVLLTAPQEKADVAFIFKELHRMEARQPNCGQSLIASIPAKWVLVSLPPVNLAGNRDLSGYHRRLVLDAIEGQPWKMTEVNFVNEMVFCIEKP